MSSHGLIKTYCLFDLFLFQLDNRILICPGLWSASLQSYLKYPSLSLNLHRHTHTWISILCLLRPSAARQVVVWRARPLTWPSCDGLLFTVALDLSHVLRPSAGFHSSTLLTSQRTRDPFSPEVIQRNPFSLSWQPKHTSVSAAAAAVHLCAQTAFSHHHDILSLSTIVVLWI